MLLLQVTSQCNNACLFCSQARQRQASTPEPEDHALLKTLQQAQRCPVAFVGGEPTLDHRLPTLIEAARTQGASSVLVQTNGRRFAYERYARQLASFGVTALEVSLQGSTAAAHDYHTQVPGSFEQTLRGIANAVEAGLIVGVTTVVSRSNLRQLVDLASRIQALGVRSYRLRRVRRVGSALLHYPQLAPAPALTLGPLRQVQRLGRQRGLAVFLERVPESEPGFVDFVGGPAEQAPDSEERTRVHLQAQALARWRAAGVTLWSGEH